MAKYILLISLKGKVIVKLKIQGCVDQQICHPHASRGSHSNYSTPPTVKQHVTSNIWASQNKLTSNLTSRNGNYRQVQPNTVKFMTSEDQFHFEI